MPSAQVSLTFLGDGDAAYPDLAERIKAGDIIECPPIIRITSLKGGMTSGATSLMLRVDLPPEPGFPRGRVLLAETSLRAFFAAARLLRIKHPDEAAEHEPAASAAATKPEPEFVACTCGAWFAPPEAHRAHVPWCPAAR